MAYFVNNKKSSYVSELELIFPELKNFGIKLYYFLEILTSRKFQIT